MADEPELTVDERPQGVLVPFPKPLSEMTPEDRRAMARVIFERISAILPPKQPG